MKSRLFNIKIKNLITIGLVLLAIIVAVIAYESYGIMKSRQNLETPEQKVMVEMTSEGEEVTGENQHLTDEENK